MLPPLRLRPYWTMHNKPTTTWPRRAVLAFNADLARRQGRLDTALEWVAGNGHRLPPGPLVTLFAAPLCCRSDPAAARHPNCARRSRTDTAPDGNLPGTSAHRPLLHRSAGTAGAAVCAAGGSVPRRWRRWAGRSRSAQPGGLQRVFLDLDAGLYDLLAELELDEEHAAFVSQLRAAINPPPGSHHEGSGREQPAADLPVPAAVPTAVPFSASQPRHPDLIELLTNRELEVLQLLALRLTNKEIAQSLGISTGTVKQHTINVFRKLHVENRREAILQARAMGFQIQTPYPL